ncbi:hypothetical protein BSL78_26129 [Apostichopus japonicus]|uniref:Uncharacterized protein n=1 Tax=Stichopus japonicus TaxID=307972 RepID=A0A2G8JMP8_STIJA|nr:hypothetical protein BSL78_26129 [Apostichopus japonicus]
MEDEFSVKVVIKEDGKDESTAEIIFLPSETSDIRKNETECPLDEISENSSSERDTSGNIVVKRSPILVSRYSNANFLSFSDVATFPAH